MTELLGHPLGLLDGDDVLFDTAPEVVRYSNAKRWTSGLTLDRFHENFPVLWGVPRPVATKRWIEFCFERMSGLPPMPGAQEGVRQLAPYMDLGMHTSRRPMFGDITRRALRTCFGEAIQTVKFANIDWDNDPMAHTRTKGDDVNDMERKPFSFYDDWPKHSAGVAAADVPVVMLFGTRPWTLNVPPEFPPEILRPRCWNELVDLTLEALSSRAA